MGVKVDDELKTRISRLAELRDRTPHWIIRAAIAEYLDKEERYQRELDEDNGTWEEFVLTGKGLTQTEVRSYFAEKIRKRDRRETSVVRKGSARSRSASRLPRRKGH